jgi:hypothetical protein
VVTQTLGHVGPSSHAPAGLHVCNIEPSHLVVPGVHAPRHAFGVVVASQNPGHEAEVQLPLASHVSRLLPLHLVWFGSHTPVHPAGVHTCGHASMVTHAPALQLRSVLPLHCLAPAVQASHFPKLQVIGVHAVPLLDQMPLPSQIWGWG